VVKLKFHTWHIIWENSMVPHGTVLGFHMEPLHCSMFGKKFMGSTRFEPVTYGPSGEVWQGRATSLPTLELNNYGLN
jgi:hypothetical protein